jgi:hypothetical protein
MKSADFCDNAAFWQAGKKSGAFRQHDAVSKVNLLELGAEFEKAFPPKWHFSCYFLQLNVALKLPRYPATQGSHHSKPICSQLCEPALTILVHWVFLFMRRVSFPGAKWSSNRLKLSGHFVESKTSRKIGEADNRCMHCAGFREKRKEVCPARTPDITGLPGTRV